MTKILDVFRNNTRAIYRGFLFALTVCLVVYFFPKEGKFQYEFQKGKPWLHENLIAPFDFAIQKSKEDVEQLRLEINEGSKLHFYYVDSIYKAHEKNLAVDINTEVQKARANGLNVDSVSSLTDMVSLAQGVLFQVYEKGILQQNNVNIGNRQEIVLVANNVGESIRLNNVYTISSATNFVENYTYGSNFIEGIITPVLIEHLEHNVFYDEETTQKVLQDRLVNLPTTKGMVQKGEIVIFRGALVDDDKFLVLSSLKQEYEDQIWTKSSY
ncbi:MAG: membrane-associated HD superfamily phosphohydrolase, partial [Flavobacteriales bacterium]